MSEPTEQITLHAGPISLDYEAGSIRAIRLGSRELLRRIYMAVRDADWNTIPARIVRETISHDDLSFRIELECENSAGEIEFSWRAIIEGGPGAFLCFQFSGDAESNFLCNRIGLCILHPIEGCAGQPCLVTHSDGSREQSRFPVDISPNQPFLDVRELSYDALPGLLSTTKVQGDVFETEDQRNWTDDSFKTYSWALANGIPVSIEKGRRIEQSVELTLRDSVRPVSLTVDDTQTYPWPAIGSTLPASRLAHLRVDVKPGESTWRTVLENAQTGVPLELALWIDGPGQLDAVKEALHSEIVRILVFTSAGKAAPARNVAAVREVFRNVPIGGGSSGDFADLNRNRDAVAPLDFLTWGVNPFTHMPDNRTAIENLAGQRATLESAKRFSGGRPFCISPIKTPQLPVANSWIAASIRELATGGAASITYVASSALLEELHALQPEHVLASYSSDPLRAEVLVVRKGSQTIAWLANFLPEQQTVSFAGREYRLAAYETLRTAL